MSAPHRMWRDILAQGDSLRRVVGYQSGDGGPALESAADTLRGAGKVVVTGMGASLYGAMPLAYELNQQGRAAMAIETGELLHFGGELARDAVVVLVSRSGETVEAVRLLPRLRELGAVVIGITNEPGATLERQADVAVLVNCGRDEAVAVQTYTGTAMVSLLLAALAAGQECWSAAEQAAEAVDITVAQAELEEWRDFFDGAGFIYVLGRGPSLASAHEGALLLNETAKLPSVAMSAGGFRHGPVEVVEAGYRAILFGNPATIALDRALAAGLTRMGGRVRVVKSAGGYFSPITDIVPVQFAAYAAALQRGVSPGQFRHVSVVTTSETEFRTDGH